jgi:phospholipid/cholesterol/gamma-HCH transport system permease protein
VSDNPEPYSLFASRPRRPAGGIAATLGARALGAFQQLGGLLATLGGAMAAPFGPGAAAGRVSNQIALRQVFFTGFQALPLVGVIAALVGTTLILQMRMVAAAVPGEVVGHVLVAVVLRELAPLTTAIIVSGRSGTAIATELGNMKAHSEILALLSLGIDPPRFVVWPRLVGTVVSVVVLTIYFGIIAIASGYLVGTLVSASSLAELRSGFATALGRGDAILFIVKTTGLGLLVGWLACHFGLSVATSPNEVPRRASQAVILSLLLAVGYNAVVTAAYYWVVGPPAIG